MLCKNQSIKKIILVEKDKDFERALCKLKLKVPKKILVYFTDFMHFDLNILSKNAKIVGNLPYNLATHFIKNFIEQDRFFFNMIFTIQTEVAKRICAKLNTKSYGYLSVLSQIFFDCKCHFDISGKIFFHNPKFLQL